MRAYEFMDEARISRKMLPTDPRMIELHKKQYELLKKRAEWLNKIAELRAKQTNEADKSSRTVERMAKEAMKRRQVDIYAHRSV